MRRVFFRVVEWFRMGKREWRRRGRGFDSVKRPPIKYAM